MSTDLKPGVLTGLSCFGPEYAEMYRRDSHAPGTVDLNLLEGMVRLTPETVAALYDGKPEPPRYEPGSRPLLERIVDRFRHGGAQEDILDQITHFSSELPEGDPPLVFGGTEEEIIERGSDWCTDVARVACCLCQVAGMAARIIVLARPSQAYSGHEIIEAYRDGRWGAADPLRGLVYRDADGQPESAWSLVKRGEFEAGAVTDYRVSDSESFDFSVSTANEYYEAILAMSRAGWPGGLKWLFGEDKLRPVHE